MTKDEHFQKIKQPGTLKIDREYFDAGWKASISEIKEYVKALQTALFTTVVGGRNKAIRKINLLKNKWKEVNED